MTTPAPHAATAAPPRRRVHPRVVLLRVCALLWVACSVAVIALAWGSEVAEDRTSSEPGYTGPSEDQVDFWLSLVFCLGFVALATGICLVIHGAVRRLGRPAVPRDATTPQPAVTSSAA